MDVESETEGEVEMEHLWNTLNQQKLHQTQDPLIEISSDSEVESSQSIARLSGPTRQQTGLKRRQ